MMCSRVVLAGEANGALALMGSPGGNFCAILEHLFPLPYVPSLSSPRN